MCVCGHARETKRKSVQNDRCREREKQTEQECQYGEWKEREHESKEGEVQDVISLLHLSRLFILLFFLSFYECLFFFFFLFFQGASIPLILHTKTLATASAPALAMYGLEA